MKRLSRIVRVEPLVVSCALMSYVVALLTPAAVYKMFSDSDRTSTIMGYEALQMGWDGAGLVTQAANPLMALSLVLYVCGKYRISRCLAFLSFALCLTAPFMFQVPVEDLRLGFYLWTLCPLLISIGAGVKKRGSIETM